MILQRFGMDHIKPLIHEHDSASTHPRTCPMIAAPFICCNHVLRIYIMPDGDDTVTEYPSNGKFLQEAFPSPTCFFGKQAHVSPQPWLLTPLVPKVLRLSSTPPHPCVTPSCLLDVTAPPTPSFAVHNPPRGKSLGPHLLCTLAYSRCAVSRKAPYCRSLHGASNFRHQHHLLPPAIGVLSLLGSYAGSCHYHRTVHRCLASGRVQLPCHAAARVLMQVLRPPIQQNIMMFVDGFVYGRPPPTHSEICCICWPNLLPTKRSHLKAYIPHCKKENLGNVRAPQKDRLLQQRSQHQRFATVNVLASSVTHI
jgi:hypothetical protein